MSSPNELNALLVSGIDQDLLRVVSIHKPGTELVREMERDTIVLKLKNGQEYPFDYVENQLEMRGN